MNPPLPRGCAIAVFWLLSALVSPAAHADHGSGGGSGDASAPTAREISGVVQSMPASGLIGPWNIAGKPVTTDTATSFDQEHGKLAVGALVEVKGTSQADGSLLASKIEVKTDVASPPGSGTPGTPGSDDDLGSDEGPGSDFKAPIVSLPASGLIGTWTVGVRTVIIVSTTTLVQEKGPFVVGAIVEVEGLPDASGAIIASKVEVKGPDSGGDHGSVPNPGEVEIVGLIETLPVSGLVGSWQVGGRTIIVSATTRLDAENGPFVVGASAEAKGALDATGALIADMVEITEGNGAPVPALEFWGTVADLPAGASGLIGVWKIDDKLVNVTAATSIDSEDAALVVGATVEVKGWLQSDGMIEASEIETRATVGSVAGQGAKAVEFFNPALGHFFISANPGEIAALDAAGKWQRTGQSFAVGTGTSAVCRFYGMPPKGPDSHFFTADPAECQAVMTTFAAWTFEGHAFSATPPVNGQCPAGSLAVHRFFNNPTTADAINHRFTVNQQAFDQTLAMGWVHEGVVMCAQP
jgi:Domain of unknown function (DUF5666)/Repeat of unknown function (DUF5648)